MPKIFELIKNSKLDREEAKIFLRHVLNFTSAQLIMADQELLTSEQLDEFYKLCELRINKVPINYILGYCEFYSREFIVTKDTLIPRPETELIVDLVLSMAREGVQVLDLGTGSGVIAVSLKLGYPKLIVSAVDKYSATLEVAKENATKLGADVDLYLSDWYTEVKGKYNIIVSNPPYIAKDDWHLSKLIHEPQMALTDFGDGLNCLRSIVQGAPKYLEDNGWLVVEHGFDQGVAVRDIYINNGFDNVKTVKDYASLDRITMGQKICKI